MPSSTMTVSEEASALLNQRLSELRDETNQIERALTALGTPASNGHSRRRVGRPKALTAGPTRVAKRARKGGTRAEQAVKLVERHPKGITANAIAKTMRIKPNYLYRVLGDLEKQGLVRKDGRTYFPLAK